LTNYLIYYNNGASSSFFSTPVNVSSSSTSYTFSSLSSGTAYLFAITAENIFGMGPISQNLSVLYSSTNVDSALVQSAPTLDVSTVTLAKTMNSITATWTTSPSTQVGYGYATITKYRYRYKANSASWPADWTTAIEVPAQASHSIPFTSLNPDT
jgi:hypothetical protein